MQIPCFAGPRIRWLSEPSRRLILASALGAAACIAPAAAQAQEGPRLEPRKGKLITSMGQPSPWGYFVAGDFGLQPIDERLFTGQFSLGFERALLNPLMSVLSVTGEYFMGIRGNAGGQVGFRGGFELPVLRVGGGWQYEFRGADSRFYLSLRHPLRRGGVFWPGGQARILWTPGKDQALTLGVTVPLDRPFAGRTRPREVKAAVPLPLSAEPPPVGSLSEGVQRDLSRVATHAQHLARLYVPYLGMPTESALGDEGDVAEALTALAAEAGLPRSDSSGSRQGRVLPVEVVRELHRSIEASFRDVAEETAIDEAVFGRAARDALLEELILPYNRFLGRKKASDTFDQLAARARVAFARDLVLRSGMDRYRIESAEAVFTEILEIVRKVERRQAAMWDDDRLSFLPLQLALLPEDHDSQEEINTLLGRAVEDRFTSGNQAWYVVDEQFEWELLRMIQDTRSYHVLWIHDFRGFDGRGDPDAVAYRTVLEGYLDALADRVEAYDREGALPVYLIVIDQWFYEVNKGRLWLSLLEDPLRHDLDLPAGFEDWEAEIRRAQDRLRRAVANSRLLQAEAREYGEDWLFNRIRVQINITNPADPTFWARELIPWAGFPDALIRDHRKISFFDVDPLDPTRGRALYTGMGVGEHYNGPTWDDRAILVQGPVLRSLRTAARDLLLQQGFDPDEIPYPLQDGEDPNQMPDPGTSATLRSSAGAGLMLQEHNLIGYGEKKASILKATLYCLMPPGAVVKAPDSLWNFPLWASLLTGVALRGGRVMVVAPSYDNAPAQAFGSMSLAENVLGQLIRASKELEPAIEGAGGLLKVGMYQPAAGVGDIPGKARQMASTYRGAPWLRDLHGFGPGELDALEALADSLDATGFGARYLEGEALEAPKLHMKAHFFATAEGWDPLMARPETEEFLVAYLRQRALQVAQEGEDRDLRLLQEALDPYGARLFGAWLRSTELAERERGAWFLLVGSHNQNFRSAMLDGEVVVAVAGRDAVIGLADFMVVLGLSEWIEDPEELNPHFPPQSGLMKGLGNWAHIIF
ncbi:MAG: hypothetical protein ACWGSQ_03865 [Longimicrobiales bacterium]